MYYLGMDLGGTGIKIGLVSLDAKVLDKKKVKTHRERTYQEIVRDMAELAIKMIKADGIRLSEIKFAGVGTPGTCDDVNGILGYANNFNFSDVPFRAEMQKYLDMPIYLENDANCAAIAEHEVGGAKGAKDSIAITLGTGIGSGIIIDGKIFRGFNNAASEMGHTSIDCDGIQCTCGRKGCWEMYASATALKFQTREAAKADPDSLINELVGGNLNKISGKTPFSAARAGDKTALMVVEKYLDYLACGLVNVINAFQPEVLTLGGGISHEGDYILEPLKKRVIEKVYSRGDIRQTTLKISKLGDDAGIIGAAMIGINR